MRAVEDFFSAFCDELASDDFVALARLFDYPVTIAYVDPTRAYNSPPELIQMLKAQAKEYRKVGAVRYAVEVQSDTHNDSGTHFVEVVWSFRDAEGSEMFAYPAGYILREDKNGDLKAIMFAGHSTEECRKYLAASPSGQPTGIALNEALRNVEDV